MNEKDLHEASSDFLIPVDASVCFGLLLEAAFLPLLIKFRLDLLPPLERDEAMDALDERALKWWWLMLGWATETGRAGSLATSDSELTLDQTEFVADLAEIARFVDLEWSAPIQQRSMSGAVRGLAQEASTEARAAMPRRVAITGRTDWQSISLAGDEFEEGEEVTEEEVEEAMQGVDLDRLPLFGEPARVTADGQHVGEVWIRIAPHSVEYLERELSTTFETLAIIEEHRLNTTRDLLHEQDEAIDPDRLAAINRDFYVRDMVIQALRNAARQIRGEKNARKREMLAQRILAHFRSIAPSPLPKTDNLPRVVRRGIEAIADKQFAIEITARISPSDGSRPDYGAALDLIDRYASKVDVPHTKAVDDLRRYLRRRTFDRGVADWRRAWSHSGIAFVILLAMLLLLLQVADVRALVRVVLEALTR